MANNRESRFHTTQWTRILGTGDESDESCEKSLIALCEIYHYPVYAFIRNRCGDVEKAQDLCQGFFAMLIEKKIYRHASRERGRFRSFLLTSVKNYLLSDYRNENRQKRAGGKIHFSLDAPGDEIDLPGDVPADTLFDQKWAATVFDRVWGLLKAEYEKAGNLERYEILKPTIDDPAGDFCLSKAGLALGLSESAAKSAAFRLRNRFRELFRDTVAELVDHPDEVEEEIRYLIQAMVRNR